jgi:hypothetical protein
MNRPPVPGFLRFPLLALSTVDGASTATVQLDMKPSVFTGRKQPIAAVDDRQHQAEAAGHLCLKNQPPFIIPTLSIYPSKADSHD